MAIPARKRRPIDDDDEPLSVEAPDVEDEEDEEEEGGDIDVEEGVRHAQRYSRMSPSRAVDDDQDDDQTIPDRVIRLTLPKPWSHLKLWVWLDYPEEVARLFGPKQAEESDDEAGERIIEGLRAVVVKHGGWRDRHGRLPQPGSREFWTRVSTPLSKAIISKLFEMIRRNPTPAASTKPKRPR